MQKTEAVDAMGQRSLLLPAWIQQALAANERLKLYLSVLQAAASHADHPEREALDFSAEMAAAQSDAAWLRNLPATASRVDDALLLPELPRLVKRLAEELATMARPLIETEPDRESAANAFRARVAHWSAWLGALEGDQLTSAQLHALTSGERGGERASEDSLHLLVMDLHRQLNRLAAALATEDVDGAHVWQVLPDDKLRIAAFMRGLNRTAPLRFDHPGLGTAATRDGTRLLLQNDIGENDVHVLVVQVEGRTVTLRYSDLHRVRFEFFQSLLQPYGARWGNLESKIAARLNEGDAFTFGTAWFECADDAALDATLEGIGSRIVFLIDWNRARKRLLPFVGKAGAIAVLKEAARLDAGHMAWLKCGGEALVYAAMQDVGQGAFRTFRIGDRLDTVLGDEDAQAFLVEVLRLASAALLAGQPAALVADETRLLLARSVRHRSEEFELLEEHAAYCHALAQAVSDGLEHDVMQPVAGGAGAGSSSAPTSAAQDLAARAKRWERQADHLVMRAREEAQRQPRWQPFARVAELSDDIADALEEAAFLMSLIADGHQQGFTGDVRETLLQLARTVLSAMQEHIKALAIARDLGSGADMTDSDAFLAATWNVLRSERQCDELLRHARRAMLASLRDAPALMLANDLAQALELASDRLLAAGYALRDVVFGQTGERR
ncbi:phosphate transport regulator [Paraburkholderia kururiensis]|uniref:phosphate transport regulator n=1 Tax=Paraburkholderia kururiensis TaxID=984307 RepID=UPI0005A66A60|nr:phosphate transport regulator [Paraburkholderia kururiensis]